jgi:hypothetical protein
VAALRAKAGTGRELGSARAAGESETAAAAQAVSRLDRVALLTPWTRHACGSSRQGGLLNARTLSGDTTGDQARPVCNAW